MSIRIRLPIFFPKCKINTADDLQQIKNRKIENKETSKLCKKK